MAEYFNSGMLGYNLHVLVLTLINPKTRDLYRKMLAIIALSCKYLMEVVSESKGVDLSSIR